MDDVLSKITQYIINPAIALVFAAGFFLFLWGCVQFLWNLDSGEQSEGKSHMIWGVVGMFIMVSVWGILGLIVSTFQLGG